MFNKINSLMKFRPNFFSKIQLGNYLSSEKLKSQKKLVFSSGPNFRN